MLLYLVPWVWVSGFPAVLWCRPPGAAVSAWPLLKPCRVDPQVVWRAWPPQPEARLLQGSRLEFTCSGCFPFPRELGSMGYLVPVKVVSTDLPSGGTCSLQEGRTGTSSPSNTSACLGHWCPLVATSTPCLLLSSFHDPLLQYFLSVFLSASFSCRMFCRMATVQSSVGSKQTELPQSVAISPPPLPESIF